MKLGLENRLRIISLLPIIVLFSITSYYVYDAFSSYRAASQLRENLQQNVLLNEIVTNVARERGMSAMYLGNKTDNIFKSLKEQRSVVDGKAQKYISYVQAQMAETSNDADKEKLSLKMNNVISSMAKIKSTRLLVNEHKIEFAEMFNNVYNPIQERFVKQLGQITENQVDKEISSLYNIYYGMANAKESSGIERAYVSYTVSHSIKMTEDDLNRLITIIAKADMLNYEGLSNKELYGKLDTIFKSEENRELLSDINSERTAIMTAADSGEYDISSGVWFSMISEKINLITNAENLLLDAMGERAKTVQSESLRVLSVTVSIWIIAIILALLGYLLSNEIARNIAQLEGVLKKVAQDYDAQHAKINLHTSEGTNQAYSLLEEIIEQTKRDKISAQEASEAKSMFLANMSHEIRTPLNGIVGFTELLKDSGLKEEQSEFVDIIEKSSENLLEIINNILDLSKIESNKLEIENIAFSPIVEFESAVEVYAVRASEKNINLGCFIDPRLEFPLKGDPTKIKEVIINLLSNAVKFTNNAGSINIDIRKLPSETEGFTRVKFEIQDSGIGVTSEQKSKIFEAFSQADTSITRKYGGTGLGLTISSSFIELMGGKLDLDSKIGEGTTFFFTLEFEEIETLSEGSAGIYSNINALIFGDAVKIKKQDKYLREYFDYLGVEYATFKDLNRVSLLSQDASYNLVFVDYDYVNEDILREISALPQEVIVLTKSSLIKRVEAHGFDIFKTLYEPIHFSKLKQAIENYMLINATVQPAKKSSRKKFDLDKSKFVADVLVAEDNVINQKLIKRTLEDLGLNVEIANNGLEAFQKRKDGQYDLIFMDIQMPFLDGVEATGEILEWEKDYKQPHTPIVALTANALKGDRERFLSAGLDEYTTKPLVRSEIIAVLNLFLADKIVDVDGIAPTPATQEKHEAPLEATTIDEQVAPSEVVAKIDEAYAADVLIAKKSGFETKLYTKVIDSLGISGLTYITASSVDGLADLVKNNSFKIVLFDKGCDGVDIEEIVAAIRDRSEYSLLKSTIALVDDGRGDDLTKYSSLVDTIVPNVINKDILDSLFTKFL